MLPPPAVYARRGTARWRLHTEPGLWLYPFATDDARSGLGSGPLSLLLWVLVDNVECDQHQGDRPKEQLHVSQRLETQLPGENLSGPPKDAPSEDPQREAYRDRNDQLPPYVGGCPSNPSDHAPCQFDGPGDGETYEQGTRQLCNEQRHDLTLRVIEY